MEKLPCTPGGGDQWEAEISFTIFPQTRPLRPRRKCGIFLGFFHEHVRYDRDEYVELNEKQVEAQKLAKQFDIGGSTMNQRVKSGYDFESVMHYPDEGLMKAKVEPIDQNTERMGWYFVNGEELSPKDKKKLEELYCGLSKGNVG